MAQNRKSSKLKLKSRRTDASTAPLDVKQLHKRKPKVQKSPGESSSDDECVVIEEIGSGEDTWKSKHGGDDPLGKQSETTEGEKAEELFHLREFRRLLFPERPTQKPRLKEIMVFSDLPQLKETIQGDRNVSGLDTMPSMGGLSPLPQSCASCLMLSYKQFLPHTRKQSEWKIIPEVGLLNDEHCKQRESIFKTVVDYSPKSFVHTGTKFSELPESGENSTTSIKYDGFNSKKRKTDSVVTDVSSFDRKTPTFKRHKGEMEQTSRVMEDDSKVESKNTADHTEGDGFVQGDKKDLIEGSTCENKDSGGSFVSDDPAAPLQVCPLCNLQFDTSFGQMEIDSHIARCLSEAGDDAMW